MFEYFDHVYSFVKNGDLNTTLALYGRAGFAPLDRRKQQAFGVTTGFLKLQNSYLEFAQVTNPEEFEKAPDSVSKLSRFHPQPSCINAHTPEFDTFGKLNGVIAIPGADTPSLAR